MQNGSLRGPRENAIPHHHHHNHHPQQQHQQHPVTEELTPIHAAAVHGDDKLLEKLINSGADRNVRDSKHGNSPLHEASWRGYSRCVKLLCALPKPKSGKESKQLKGALQETKGVLHSALLGTRNYGGFSALHLAAQNGHNQSCREILLAGGDPDVQNNYGDAPLHTACRYGHAGATRILLSAKCDIHRVNLNGDTALHISCAMGRRKLTRILLEAGSRHDIKNAQNETPKDIAIRKNLKEIQQILDSPVTVVSPELRRDRSSTSSKHKNHHTKDEVDSGGKKRDKSSSSHKNKKPDKTKNGEQAEPNPANWSPYGCHYYPDPRSFPKPRLETLPKEPLAKGEQYYLDLAGNIRKGPIGVGNSCYCGPFFRHIEDKITKNKKSIKKYVDRATEKLDHKVQELASRTEDQIGELTRNMITERIRCEGRRIHLDNWLKRGGLARATVANASNLKSRKNQENTNTLTRCRSLEMIDIDHPDSKIIENGINSTTNALSRSYDMLDYHQVEIHSPPTGFKQHIEEHFIDNRSSGLGSDRIDKLTLSDDSRFRKGILKVGSKKSSDQSSSLMGSDITNRSSNTNRDFSLNSNYPERHFVDDRLEELLSKTHEIIEMEKATRKRTKDLFMIQPEEENLRRRNERRVHRLSSSVDLDDSEYIAQEMEKITSSLMNGNHLTLINGQDGPVSPEIAKDTRTEKEKGLPSRSRETSRSSNEYPQNQIHHDVYDPQMMGFYQNTNFGHDIQSSSSNTLKSEKAQVVESNEDKIGDLSELTNIRDLNELKNRILNGSHWKSQVLKKSLQQASNQNGHQSASPLSFDDGSKTPDQVESTPIKYDIRNGEIKTLRKEIANMKNGKVLDMVARFQSQILSSNHNDNDGNDSESSEEEDQGLDSLPEQAYPSESPSVSLNFENFNNGLLPANYYRTDPTISLQYDNDLIPKDAYFHDIPNKQNPNLKNLAARTRHPLPIQLNEEIFHPNQMQHYPNPEAYPCNNYVQNLDRPRLEYYQVYNNHDHQLNGNFPDHSNVALPNRDKLLASRKFQYTNLMEMDLDVAKMNGNAASIDQIQLERESNNDSGYSTKLGGSSHGPSPSLSGQIDLDSLGPNFSLAQNPLFPQQNHQFNHDNPGRGGAYYQGFGGASSLV